MTEDRRARLQALLKSGKARLLPLSLTQRELWQAAPYVAEDVSNHIGALIFIRGAIPESLVRRVIEQTVTRQEVMRLSILPGKREPVQVVRGAIAPALRFREMPSLADAALEALSLELFREPLDMIRGPLYRFDGLRRAADDLVIALSIHHAIADGWSFALLMQNLWAAIVDVVAGREPGPAPLDTSFSAWAAAERAFWTDAELEPRAEFWRSRLSGARRLLDGAAGSSSRRQRQVSFVPADTTRMAREVARRTGATLFSTLLAAFQLALSEWSGVDDILVGTPVANRTRLEIRETIGYFSTIVPLRGRIDRTRSFGDHLRLVHHDTVESFAHAMPFVELVGALGETVTPGRNPVFDVRFAFQNYPVPGPLSLPGLSLRFKQVSTGTARFDLACEITEDGDRMEVVWLFRPDLLEAADIAELDRLWAATLTRGCLAALEGTEGGIAVSGGDRR